MDAIANKCVSQVKDVVSGIEGLSGKVFFIAEEGDLQNKLKGLVYPIVGILYGGMKAISEGEKSSMRVGVSAELSITIIWLEKKGTLQGTDNQVVSIDSLDTLRRAFRGVRSPSGHVWRFLLEGTVPLKDGVIAFFQKWSCPVQLV